MVLWDVPKELEIGIIPKRLYCNRDLIEPATAAFTKLIQTGAVRELMTFDGCFNIRKMRGLQSMSLHSWGVALDFDAFRNQLGKTPTMSHRVADCFVSSGFDWGGLWQGKRCDGMHFQLAKI
jgi:hypothetical protein